MILPGVELKIFDLGVGELPPGLTLNRGGKMTKISSWGGKFFFSLAVLKSCPCMYLAGFEQIADFLNEMLYPIFWSSIYSLGFGLI